MNQKKNKLLHKPKKMAAGTIITFLIAFGIAGCGTQQAASTQQTQSQSTQNQSAQTQTDQEQKNPDQMSANPAVKAAMDVLQLQRSQQVVLTSEQSNTIKPILQELISTSNPTDDVLQTKADAITGVFTDQQKSFLAQGPGGNRHNGNNNSANPESSSNTSNPSDNSSSSANSSSSGGTNASPNGTKTTNGTPPANNDHSFNAQDIYKQALAALK